MSKRYIFLIIGFLLGLFLIISSMNRSNDTPFDPGTKIVVDEDTGKKLIIDENVTNESVGAGYISLLNGDDVYIHLSDSQFSTLRISITDYLYANLEGEVPQIIKVLKDSTKYDGTYITTTLKSDDPLFTINISIEPVSSRLVKVRYLKSSNPSLPQFTTGFLPDEYTDYGGEELIHD